MASISRRFFLARGSCSALALALLPGLSLTGCTPNQGLQLQLPSGRQVSPGQVIASGVAYQNETPSALFLRVTTNDNGKSMEIQRLRGLVTWRVVTDSGSVLVTIGQDALPTSYQFSEGVVVEFALAKMVDAYPVTEDDTVASLMTDAPTGVALVVLRDHQVIGVDNGYQAQDGDYAVFIDPNDEEDLVA